MNTSADVSVSVNKPVYASHSSLGEYTYYTLTRMETMTFLKYQPMIAGRDVLDIGVGGGRTTVYLAPLAGRYEGVDFSPVMVEHMRSSMPDISVRQADMRDLGVFPDESFDFIFASDNVLDDVAHEGRLQTLAEFHRVLRSGGILAFASHNRMFEQAGSGPQLSLVRNPITQINKISLWLLQLSNHAKIGKMRVVTDEYAIYNDVGHDFSCLHYYIAQSAQRRQLTANRFSVVEVLDGFGRPLSAADAAEESPSLMYIARKL